MLIGHNVTGRVNDETRAEALQTLANLARLAAIGTKEFGREIFKRIADLSAYDALGINVNDRRHYLCDC